MAGGCRDCCGRRRIREGKAFKRLAVRTLVVHLGLETWQVAQTFCTLSTPGGAAPWFPWQVVQVGALRSPCTTIASMVHAGVVLRKLIGGNAVRLHVRRVGVAARACRRHVDGIDRGTGIAGRPDIVDAMAIDADRNLGVSRRQPFAVHAGVVLVQLVGAQAGVVLPDIGRIRVAASAQLRHLLAIDLALQAGLACSWPGWDRSCLRRRRGNWCRSSPFVRGCPG